jgi:TaqI-like C-terminal specificity domain
VRPCLQLCAISRRIPCLAGAGRWQQARRGGRLGAVTDHLAPFEQKARIRTDQGQYWWELRACSFSNQFLKPKIVYPVISQGPKFAIDENAYFTNDKCFMVEADYFLLGLLNSRLTWFNLFGITSPLRGGQWRLELREQYMSKLPIPPPQDARKLPEIAEQCAKAWTEKARIIAEVDRRIPDLCPSGRAPKLTNRLHEWWTLDFKSFQAEIKKAFKTDIPLKQRNGWESFLREEGEKVRRLTAEIEQAERESDAIVYKLFDLTPDEIALLESSLAGQY